MILFGVGAAASDVIHALFHALHLQALRDEDKVPTFYLRLDCLHKLTSRVKPYDITGRTQKASPDVCRPV